MLTSVNFTLYGAQLKDGRWAYTEVTHAKDEDARFPEVNVYGKLRSPWNTNDRK